MNAINRVVCRIFGHRPEQRRNLLLVPGVLLSYPTRCGRCGTLIDVKAVGCNGW